MRFNSERTPRTTENFHQTARGQLEAAADCNQRGIDIFVHDINDPDVDSNEVQTCRRKTHNLRQVSTALQHCTTALQYLVIGLSVLLPLVSCVLLLPLVSCVLLT